MRDLGKFSLLESLKEIKAAKESINKKTKVK